MRLISLFLIFFAIAFPLIAQYDKQPPATLAEARVQSFEQRQALEAASIVNGIEFSNIGPTVFSGRVSDLEVRPEDPSHFFAAYASGGLWKTENNGITFAPLFEQEMVMTIGDIAVDWNSNTIWVGTGEVNSSRSSYAGTGMYRSTDGGKTWEHKGLPESHHIGRVILHPEDPNTVWVAVLGHLYSPNAERGVYKTTDGGDNWNKVLFVNENAGAVDLIIDPDDPNVLYAATWERSRRAWDFTESGPGSGIWMSVDGGENWSNMTPENAGFPTGEGAGRIGLDLAKQDGQPILYASIDNYNRRPAKEEVEEKDGLDKEKLRRMSAERFLELDQKQVERFLRENNFPQKYNYDKVKSLIESGNIQPEDLVLYNEDANSLLFDTPVVGLEVYRLNANSKKWEKTHDGYLDAVYNSYGYYFGQIRVAPYDPDQLYVLGVPILRSDDGGKTWNPINGENVHSDHHALWINPDRPGHIILGNDGGVNISYDYGENWSKCNMPAVGQFYYIAVDQAEPYRVYGGLQDNGVWMGPHTYEAGVGWQGSGEYPYRSIMGGDGMQVAVDNRDNETVYTGFQFGNYFRLNTRTGDRKFITPKHELGERPLRWNWQAPIHLSNHNQDIFYMGSNKLHRSFDQGNTFQAISDNLTKGGIKGDVPFGTLSTIHESPMQFGLIYTGSDDGLVYVTRDGGVSWTNISKGLPEDMWVSRIQASQFGKSRVYVTLNGYRWDDFTPYLFVSEDYGANWKPLGKGQLPLEPLNVVKEDPVNAEVLYVGSDHGLYVSLDRGETFMLMNNGLPAVPVHDVVVHPTARDLLVGTHGRSIYRGSVEELQQLTAEKLQEQLLVFNMEDQRVFGRWGSRRANWAEAFEPETHIPVFLRDGGQARIQVYYDDLMLQELEVDGRPGLNYAAYDYTIDPSKAEGYAKALNADLNPKEEPVKVEAADNGKVYLKAGKYRVEVLQGKAKGETTFTLKY